MKSNKFWITTSLIFIGIIVYLFNELYTLDEEATKEIETCQESMIGVAMYAANFSCISTVEYMCSKQVNCSTVSIEQIQEYCNNFKAE